MSPAAASTAKTAIYVVGGLVALSTVAGIIIFATTASTISKQSDQAVAPNSAGNYVLNVGDQYVITFNGGPSGGDPTGVPSVAQAQAAFDAEMPGQWSVIAVAPGGSGHAQGSWQAGGVFTVTANYIGQSAVNNNLLLGGWGTVPGLTFVAGPAMSVQSVQDFGSVGAGQEIALTLRLAC
jgi:hypothetical protein